MISTDALHRVDNHWAVLAVGAEERDRGLNLGNARLLRRAVGQQLALDFQFHVDDDALLGRLADAYEMAAIEGLHLLRDLGSADDELRAQCVAGAWRAFELYRLLDIPHDEDKRIFHVLHVSSLAYCGDRWSDLRRWYGDNDDEIEAPSTAGTSWDRRLLYRIYDCWLRLFRKDGWDDIDRIREIVAGLREDQRQYEAQLLNSPSAMAKQTIALRLVAMYHWAKATEVLAVYMLQGTPPEVNVVLSRHFDQAIRATATTMDADFEVLFRWLASAARQMVGGSLWGATRGVNSKG